MVEAVPTPILLEIEAYLGSKVRGFSFSAGGCVNKGGKLVTTGGIFFLKWNDHKKCPGMFRAEAEGLTLLRSRTSLVVPGVTHVGVAGEWQFLLMEFIEEGDRGGEYWSGFGSGLAGVHRFESRPFGLEHDNYIGILKQSNTQSLSWIEFFVEQRLRPQLKLAVDEGKAGSVIVNRFEALFTRLSVLLPEEKPSLLHGDLWGGNQITTSDGRPCLIDPAVYYGNREVDLAMTQLFGGFDVSYLYSYNEVHPLLPGFQERVPIYNLYPLLVHVNLFGGGYLSQVKSVLEKFV